MRDAAGMEIGDDMVKAGKGQINPHQAEKNSDVDEMQRKLDALKR